MTPRYYPKILIVESYSNHAKSLSAHLQGAGIPFELRVASGAEAALAGLEETRADLVIIDALLRGQLDGYDLCRALRSADFGRDLPVILLLAGNLVLERIKGIEAGADLLLHRPIVKEELVKMVRLLLGSLLPQAHPPPRRQARPMEARGAGYAVNS
jgi:DNA-binding response OmpR family regulator